MYLPRVCILRFQQDEDDASTVAAENSSSSEEEESKKASSKKKGSAPQQQRRKKRKPRVEIEHEMEPSTSRQKQRVWWKCASTTAKTIYILSKYIHISHIFFFVVQLSIRFGNKQFHSHNEMLITFWLFWEFKNFGLQIKSCRYFERKYHKMKKYWAKSHKGKCTVYTSCSFLL